MDVILEHPEDGEMAGRSFRVIAKLNDLTDRKFVQLEFIAVE